MSIGWPSKFSFCTEMSPFQERAAGINQTPDRLLGRDPPQPTDRSTGIPAQNAGRPLADRRRLPPDMPRPHTQWAVWTSLELPPPLPLHTNHEYPTPARSHTLRPITLTAPVNNIAVTPLQSNRHLPHVHSCFRHAHSLSTLTHLSLGQTTSAGH